ncbi:MAG TPA: adenylate/guanylate cyclase domain-containing protein [Oligoflexus sp.]|uniref:adenylate/guanylate cyclase domain-containing protein n=1 Tax=Oligoflexus sp. TaxID=1971216 RepID=UPI002D4329A8|nr:adenylate/guanylate cyclase domain-containing protein [Oligoflexus sp.]HYX34397.1 adenylate/guanylate cyclase domain-containing protein [Oligoflexus sp.]
MRLYSVLMLLISLLGTTKAGFAGSTSSIAFRSIDLTEAPWMARQGFSHDWVQHEFQAEERIKQRFPMLMNEIFQTPYGLRFSEFTLQTEFWLEPASLQESLVLFLEQIGEGWEVYLNGHLLESQLFLSPDGQHLLRYRVAKNVALDLPYPFLRSGKNILTIRLAGHHPLSSINLNAMNGLGRFKYLITSTRQVPSPNPFLHVVLFTTLVTVGSFFLVSYVLITPYRYFLFAGLFLIDVGMFYVFKTGLVDHLFDDIRYKLKLEFIVLAGTYPLQQLSVDSFLFNKERPPFFSKFIYAISSIFIIGYLFTPVPFNQVMIRAWQLLAVFIVVWLIYRLFTAVRLKKRDAKKCALLLFAGAVGTWIDMLSNILNVPVGETGQYVALCLVFLLIFILSKEQLRSQLELQQLAEALTQEKESIARFVPTQYLTYLGKNSTVEVKLGDQVQRTMCILFADIRSFTALSEQMTPQATFNFINDYLGRVGPIIRQHGGIIDKYIGDGIMALFPGSADDAVQAAIAIQKEVEAYNRQREAEQKPPIAVGIGIHRGELMLGTVGESQRMEGTVISDSVNVASRLEGWSKHLSVRIVASQALLDNVKQGMTGVRRLGRIAVKGKVQHIEAVEIFEGAPDLEYRGKMETLALFHEAMAAFHAAEWTKAVHLFSKVLEQNPRDLTSRFYKDQSEKRNQDALHGLDQEMAV